MAQGPRQDPHFLHFPYNHLDNFNNLPGRIIRLLPGGLPPFPPHALPPHRYSDYHEIVRVATPADPPVFQQTSSNRSWVVRPINWPGGNVIDTTGGGAHGPRLFYVRINFDFHWFEPNWPNHPTDQQVNAYIAQHGPPPVSAITFGGVGYPGDTPTWPSMDQVNLELVHPINPLELGTVAHRIDSRTRKMLAKKVFKGAKPEFDPTFMAKEIGKFGGRKRRTKRRRKRKKTRRTRRRRRRTRRRRRPSRKR